MKVRIVFVALIAIASSASSYARHSITPIVRDAIVTLKIPGFADFLVADGTAVWATNSGRVEKLQSNQPGPISTVPVPDPCGAMELGFGALWVADCQNASLYLIDP